MTNSNKPINKQLHSRLLPSTRALMKKREEIVENGDLENEQSTRKYAIPSKSKQQRTPGSPPRSTRNECHI